MSTMSPSAEISRLLREHNAVKVRSKKHQVWKLDGGRTFVQASTPSDVHAANAQLRDLRRILNLNGTRGLPGERRDRNHKSGVQRVCRITPSLDTLMAEKMRQTGLIEEGLRDQIERLKEQLRLNRMANKRRRRQLRQIEGHVLKGWGCRLRRLLRATLRRLRGE